MTFDEEQKLLIETAAKLGEHFDSVQIVITKVYDDGMTGTNCGGYGDWYARRAACQEFIEREQAAVSARISKDINEGSGS